MIKDIAIAIDGPAAAGKSTVAKIVAEYLSYIYIDTGAMYRAITLNALHENVDLNDEESLRTLLLKTKITFKKDGNNQNVFVNDEDVTDAIRTKEVTNNVSIVSKHKSVREEMVNRQREMAKNRRVVMDGRDIGTDVIPDAEVKIFLIASVEERAQRRHKENIEKGFESDLEELKKEIEQRDKIDSEREVSPLTKAEDAIEIDTTSLSINQVADKILERAKKELNK